MQPVKIFRDVKRVLKPPGMLWLNTGDSYADSVTVAIVARKLNHTCTGFELNPDDVKIAETNFKGNMDFLYENNFKTKTDMKITVESTTEIVYINGIPARVWEGQTESGINMHCYITRIAIDENEPRVDEFEAELQEQKKPVVAYPLYLFID